jgi:hypothetical protein
MNLRTKKEIFQKIQKTDLLIFRLLQDVVNEVEENDHEKMKYLDEGEKENLSSVPQVYLMYR